MTSRICEACSTSFLIRDCDVKRGRGRFCGKSCAATGVNGNSYKHGNSTRQQGQTKEYRTWAGVKSRTTNMTLEHAPYYIGRGITMCDRWFDSFENFLADMGPAPSPRHTIERIENDGNYEPGNCRWATHAEQMENIRSNRYIEFNGERHTQEEWGRITGIGGVNILRRLKRGWTVEEAMTLPKGTYLSGKQGTIR